MWTQYKHQIRAITAVLIFAFLSACVSPDSTLRAGSVLRSIDNDAFDKSDDQYTSGLSLAYISKPESTFAETPLPTGVASFLDERWPFADQQQRFAIHSISHRIFTPTDLENPNVIENDLPYSALLYATTTVGSQGPNSLTAMSLSLGVTGPLALGDEIQTSVHSLIGSEDPQGWDNQIENEPLLNIGFDYRRRMLALGEKESFGSDLLVGVSGSAGNLQTQASLASTLRVGYRVPSNFHMQAPFLADESLGLREYDRLEKRRSLYAFAGFAATALANAIYLDGNTFRDSHSVSHDNYVLRASAGVAARRGPILATLTYEQATLPWDHPDGLDEENYVRLGVSWDF